jgi:hypothetical protein
MLTGSNACFTEESLGAWREKCGLPNQALVLGIRAAQRVVSYKTARAQIRGGLAHVPSWASGHMPGQQSSKPRQHFQA